MTVEVKFSDTTATNCSATLATELANHVASVQACIQLSALEQTIRLILKLSLTAHYAIYRFDTARITCSRRDRDELRVYGED